MTSTTTAATDTRMARRAAIAGGVGAVIDWYDFYLYGTAGALVFGSLFFPGFSPAAGTLAAFATFAVGFFFRPLGGIVFGHVGDRLGRRGALFATVTMMGLASVLIGLLPPYASIGIWAPVLLVLLRAVQGFAVGGEWGGAALMAVEHAPPRSRALYGSGVQIGSFAGSLLATGMITVMSVTTTDEQFMAWGWRIPFLASIVLVVVGLVVRHGVAESPVVRGADAGSAPRVPLLAAIRSNPSGFLLIIGMRLAELVPFYLVTVFALAFATQQAGVDKDVILNATLVATAVGMVTIPLFAALSDRIGRVRVFLGGAAVGCVIGFPLFWSVTTAVPWLIGLFVVLSINLVNAPVISVQQPLFTEMFGERFRYSGAGVAYQIAGAIGGGLTPLIASTLAVLGGGAWQAVAVMMSVACVLALLSGWVTGRRTG